MTLSTLASIERRLAQLPPSGHARRMALDGLRADLRDHYGGEERVRPQAARVKIEGIVAHGVDLAGALKNWCATVRRGMQEDAA